VGCLGAIVVIALLIAIRVGIHGLFNWGEGSTQSAKADVGDCVHTSEILQTIKKVDCTDPTADAKVLAKLDGKTKSDFELRGKDLCAPYNATSDYWQGTTGLGGTGYLLCLGPK
jgi:hypothetical protein